ncbi:MAG: hypothetical protein HC887_11875 [Desulfobacteraceae bacterium]|nr:hypothetical protein [Desulfobacteraceae bacterium]
MQDVEKMAVFRHRSFQVKLYIAFGGIILPILLMTGIVGFSVKKFGHTMNDTMGAVDEIRRMFSAMRLSENSSKLVSIAPVLSASENETQLAETWKQIVSLLDSTGSELDALDKEKSHADKSVIAEMKRDHSGMKNALERLKQSVSKQIGLRKQRNDILDDLRKLQNDLTDAIEPAVYAISSWAK